MAENKTQASKASVTQFINSVENPQRRKDAKVVAKIMREVSGKRPKMWGPSIVGYGEYHYKYDSGREGDFMRLGFSPRKAELVVYIMPGYSDYGPLLKKLGKHRKGKSCLYIRKLEDINLDVLKELIQAGWNDMLQRYPV